MAIGAGREMLMYMGWLMSHPNATKQQERAFLQSIVDDPENSLRKKSNDRRNRNPAPGPTSN